MTTDFLHRRTPLSSVPPLARLRLPRLRERPINASGAEPPSPQAPADESESARSNGGPAATATLPSPPPAPPAPLPPEEPELEPLPPLTLFSKVMLVAIPLGLVALALYFFGVFDASRESEPGGPAPRIEGTGAPGTGAATATDATDLGFPSLRDQEHDPRRQRQRRCQRRRRRARDLPLDGPRRLALGRHPGRRRRLAGGDRGGGPVGRTGSRPGPVLGARGDPGGDRRGPRRDESALARTGPAATS